MTPAWPSWLSPIGYGQFTGAFVENDLTPLLVPLGFAAALIALVYRLQSVRDQGASLLAGRAGRATAGPVLSSSFGLAWRLTRRSCCRGPPAASRPGCSRHRSRRSSARPRADNPQVIEILRRAIGNDASIEEAFVATFYGVVGILAACCAVQVGIRARQEEAHGTAELVLGTPCRACAGSSSTGSSA